MPDTGLLTLSVLCVGVGVLLILFPRALMSAGRVLNQTLVSLDPWLMRYRYTIGVIFAVGGYALFRIALLWVH